MRNSLRFAGASFLVAISLLFSTAGRAELVGETFGSTFRLLANISGVVTSPVGDLLVDTAQVAGTGTTHTFIRIQGRYVQLAAGTAAFQFTFTHAGESRRVLVIRPEPAYTGAPVLLMLHGNGGTSENQANIAYASDLVAAEGVWVVLPEALDGTWDVDPENPIGVDDVGFLSDVVTIITTTFQADRTRLYVSGLSNGSFMAERFACERPDLVAATAVVAGTISSGQARSCSPSSPRPIMFVAGTADAIVPYNGSRMGVRSAPEAFNFWTTLHNCASGTPAVTRLPDVANDYTTIDLMRKDGCGSGGEVRLYTVNGGGHAWPGGWQYLAVAIIGRTSMDMSTTSVIWEFARQYSLP